MLSLHFIDGAGVTCTAEELPPPTHTIQSSLAQLTASPPIPSGVVLATELSAVHNCCRSGRGSLLFCQLARRVEPCRKTGARVHALLNTWRTPLHSANQAHILLGVLNAARRVCGIFAFTSLANLQALASCGRLASGVVFVSFEIRCCVCNKGLCQPNVKDGSVVKCF